MRQILHIDMDAFYASVEQRDDPSLRGKPVIVGGASRRGVVSAASYEARPFGVRSAMSMVEALRRCPQAIVVAGHMSRYVDVSREIFDIFRRYTPLVEGLSLDEAFLDVTGSRSLFGDGECIAAAIRSAIKNELDLTASAGVARCKFAAKIASDLDKPDGLVVVPDDVAGFIAQLPIERMWGVGPKAAARIHAAGFQTIGDLAQANVAVLRQLLGSWGERVHELANGIDDRGIHTHGAPKSVGAEETFERDLMHCEDLLPRLLSQSSRVASRMFTKGLFGRCVTLKIKYANHKSITRRTTLSEPIADTDSIYAAAKNLLRQIEPLHKGVRLTGVSVSELGGEPAQSPLFEDGQQKKRREVEQVTADIRSRYGQTGLLRASLLRNRD